MSIFHSEPMALCQIILHTESAFNCLIELGNLGKVHFRPFTQPELAATQRCFQNEIKKCQRLQMILETLIRQLKEANIAVIYCPTEEGDPHQNDLETIETRLIELFREISELRKNILEVESQKELLKENLQVLKLTESIFNGQQNNESILAYSDKMLFNFLNAVDPIDRQYLCFICGTIPKIKYKSFERIVWRFCRGKLNIKNFDLCQDHLPFYLRKDVFLILFIGEILRKKILAVCQGFGANVFTLPQTSLSRFQLYVQIKLDLLLMEKLARENQSLYNCKLFLAASELNLWKAQLKKICKVYNILKLMVPVNSMKSKSFIEAECWIPQKYLYKVRRALDRGCQKTFFSSSSTQTQPIFLPLLVTKSSTYAEDFKPSYFEVNKFTKVFQHLIEAYGTPKNNELNPAPFIIVTFPFLFAVMFGDVGHGLIVFILGIWLHCNWSSLGRRLEVKNDPNNILNFLFQGRYIITIMGIFSIYTGLIYNDCFSKAFNLFGSSWRVTTPTRKNFKSGMQLNPADSQFYKGTPYLMGIDPIWKASGENALPVFNSIKMKLAIILGVAHMTFGMFLSASNALYRREQTELLTMILPRIFLFLSIFFYLVFLIFYKWINYGGLIQKPYNTTCAPSILVTFIDMIFIRNAPAPLKGCDPLMFSFQNIIQSILLVVAICCIVILLVAKPVNLMLDQNKSKQIEHRKVNEEEQEEDENCTEGTDPIIQKALKYDVYRLTSKYRANKSKIDSTIDTNMRDVWIQSFIHCIEVILGFISHTSSYIRLWALSLAHERVSTILWNMFLRVGFTKEHGFLNAVVLYIAFLCWSTLTFSILIVMQGVSAFLHALRLHWIEFQWTFYDGSGEPFQPFKFEDV